MRMGYAMQVMGFVMIGGYSSERGEKCHCIGYIGCCKVGVEARDRCDEEA